MANPSRTWAIITALAAQLATITIATGYNTDAGLNVWTTDAQRDAALAGALGMSIYSESIIGPGLDNERPGKQVRDFTMLVEASIGTDIDNAQAQMHALIEDVEFCIKRYTQAQTTTPGLQVTPMHIADVAILDRPEGMAVVAMQARVIARFFR